jgi:pimeloyl-ACP methyl ester carboxylesterase
MRRAVRLETLRQEKHRLASSQQASPSTQSIPVTAGALARGEQEGTSVGAPKWAATSEFSLSASIAILLSILLTSCAFLAVPQQQQRLQQICRIQGSAQLARAQPGAIVVLLLRQVVAALDGSPGWKIVDHFVLDHPGPWAFVTNPGTFRLAAFVDANSDETYEPGEPFMGTSVAQPIVCGAGARITGVVVAIPAQPTERFDRELDVASLQALGADERAEQTLGQLTAVGEVTTLADPRFDLTKVSDGLWKPYDYMLTSPPGVYFLEPYDPNKVPVLFVHGIAGSPANFAYLIEHLDRTRFQAWVYNYPSGIYLSAVADHLNQTIQKLQLRYHVRRIAVVAHSVGGLVSRGFILRHAVSSSADEIPLFVSMATPWEGHDAATNGVKYSPIVVNMWRDVTPGSDYLQSLYAVPLPTETKFHLLFTFRRKSASFGESDDQTVTVASELGIRAQRDAVRLYGFNDSHDEILQDPATSELLDSLLAETFLAKTKGSGFNASLGH